MDVSEQIQHELYTFFLEEVERFALLQQRGLLQKITESRPIQNFGDQNIERIIRSTGNELYDREVLVYASFELLIFVIRNYGLEFAVELYGLELSS